MISVSYHQAEKSFEPAHHQRFESYVGWVKYFHLGSLEGHPACKVDTCYVHPDMHNNTTAASAVGQMLHAFQGQSATLVYPPNFRELKADRDAVSMYVFAETTEELCSAIMLFPTLGTNRIVCNRIRSDYK